MKQGRKDLRVKPELQDLRATRVHREHRVFPGLRVKPVPRDLKAIPELRDRKVILEHRVRKVILERRDHRVLPDRPEPGSV